MQITKPTGKMAGCRGLCHNVNMRYSPDGIQTVCRVCRTQRIFTKGTMADYKKMFPSEFLKRTERKKLNPRNKLVRFRPQGINKKAYIN